MTILLTLFFCLQKEFGLIKAYFEKQIAQQ